MNTLYEPRTLIPRDGYYYCSHKDKTIVSKVLLGINADASEWVEITIEEAEALQKQWEEEIES